MEKSVGIGLEPFIRKIPGMKQIDPKQCSPLVLAYVGDCVFDRKRKPAGPSSS